MLKQTLSMCNLLGVENCRCQTQCMILVRASSHARNTRRLVIVACGSCSSPRMGQAGFKDGEVDSCLDPAALQPVHSRKASIGDVAVPRSYCGGKVVLLW